MGTLSRTWRPCSRPNAAYPVAKGVVLTEQRGLRAVGKPLPVTQRSDFQSTWVGDAKSPCVPLTVAPHGCAVGVVCFCRTSVAITLAYALGGRICVGRRDSEQR